MPNNNGYDPTDWENGQTHETPPAGNPAAPQIIEQNFNKMEQGIHNLHGYEDKADVVANFDPTKQKHAYIFSEDGEKYVWNPNSSAADNGGVYCGSVIEVNNNTGNGRLEIASNIVSAVSFGAKKTALTADIVANTTAVQNAVNAAKNIFVPLDVWYDWSNITLPDQSRITDESGYDAKASSGREQSYRRILQRTSDNTGQTNGNSEVLTGEYHPAYYVHSLAPVPSAGARSSLVLWSGTTSAPFRYGTQFTQNLTVSGKPEIELNGYDNVASPSVSTAVMRIAHPSDEDNSGSFSHNRAITPGFTFDFGLAGLSRIANWLTKNYTGAFSLPSGSTAKHSLLFRKGTVVNARIEVEDDKVEILSKAARYTFHDDGVIESKGGVATGNLGTYVAPNTVPESTILLARWKAPPIPVMRISGDWRSLYDGSVVGP